MGCEQKMNSNEKKSLKLKFPCDPKRFIDVISLCDEGGKPRQELMSMRGKSKQELVSILEKKGYYKLKTREYIRYSTHWGLLKEGKVLVPTDLGKIFLQSWNKKKEKTAKEILYYSFVTSKKFPALRYLVLELAKQLRTRGKFEISQTKIHNIIRAEYEGLEPRDSAPLSRALFVLGLLEKQKKQILIRPYFPTLEGFFLTMFHYYLVNLDQGGKRISMITLENSDFIHYWFLNEKILNQYINQGHNKRIIHREKYADVNQFYFLSENLMELTKCLVG